jgi:hypothetical protein
VNTWKHKYSHTWKAVCGFVRSFPPEKIEVPTGSKDHNVHDVVNNFLYSEGIT